MGRLNLNRWHRNGDCCCRFSHCGANRRRGQQGVVLLIVLIRIEGLRFFQQNIIAIVRFLRRTSSDDWGIAFLFLVFLVMPLFLSTRTITGEGENTHDHATNFFSNRQP